MNHPLTTQRSKIALVLAGGGVAGAMYEIGALCAIDAVLPQLRVNDFDMYVGTSAGAFIAACIANGLSPQTLLTVVTHPLPGIEQLTPDHIFAFKPTAALRRSVHLPAALLATVQRILREGRNASLVDLIESLSTGLPTGLYDPLPMESYLRNILFRSGGSNDFRTLPHILAIIATDLNTGQRAVFGQPPLEHIPISLAACASAAMPIFYQPVRIEDRVYIDGGIRGTASLDVAVDSGAQLIICVNPLVPFDNSQHLMGHSLSDQGIQRIGNQAFRTFAHAGLQYHLKQVRRQHPDVDIMLIEPQANDMLMFDENAMRYHTRLQIAHHGMQTVAAHFQQHAAYYRSVLARHGVRMHPDHPLPTLTVDDQAGRLIKRGPSIPTSTGASRALSVPSAGLSQTLAELDRLLQHLEQQSDPSRSRS